MGTNFWNADATAANNTTLGGTGIEGSDNVANFDNALREQHAQTKRFALDLGGTGTVGGTANAITITTAQTITAYSDGLLIAFIAGSDNTATGVTAAIDGMTGKAVKKADGGVENALAIGDIRAGGLYMLRYRSAWADGAGALQLIDLNVTDLQSALDDLQSALGGLFYKVDHESVAFTKTGAGSAKIKAGTKVAVNGSIVEFATATAITMPTLTAGTDYAIWVNTDESIQATTDFTTPPSANARKIGGFHYAPGGNATAFDTGGDTTPAINEYSFWDLKWRPACPDPRGMTLVAGGFWCDIYLLGVNHHTDGTSAYNVTIADGSSPPKVPTAFGGNGSTDYGTFTSFEAREVMASHGKQLLSYAEFMAAAYGTYEAASGGTDPVSTILRAAYTSIWGVMLASGNMWIWGREFGGPDSGASWNTSTEGRGSVYNQPNAALFGGSGASGADAGSRASSWSTAPWASDSSVGARGRSDHLCLV